MSWELEFWKVILWHSISNSTVCTTCLLCVFIFPDLPELTCSMFDEKLMPEHLFRVCLEYQRTSAASLNCSGYNAYKVWYHSDCTLMSISFLSCIKLCMLQDPNPSVMFKMVEPLTTLQEKVRNYLEEWPDHPGLLKILDTVASLLAMPLSTPISKVCYPVNVHVILSY